MGKGGVRMTGRGIIRRICVLLVCTFLFPVFSVLATDEYNAANPGNLTQDHIRAASAIVINADTGDVLFEKNADELRYPASTTKILTVLLGILMGDMDKTVVMTPSAAETLPPDSSNIPLAVGQEINFKDLLYATLVASGNDGANLIAETIGGSQEGFANIMNEALYKYGCTSTHFVNAHGLHDDYHVTTARDLATLAREAMSHEEFREIAKLTSFSIPPNNVVSKTKTVSTRDVIFKKKSDNADDQPYFFEYATGIKTGHTDPAGYCYVASAYKDGISLISVVLKESSYKRCFSDSIRLLNYGFSQYIATSVEEMYRENPKVIDISAFALDDPDLGRLQLDIHKMDAEADDHIIGLANHPEAHKKTYAAQTTFQFTRTLEAPIDAGETIGIMTYTPENGDAPVEYELTASRAIARRAALAPSLAEIRQFADTDPNPFPKFSFELVMILLLPVIAVALLSNLFYRLLSRKRRPKLKQKNRFKTRYYR